MEPGGDCGGEWSACSRDPVAKGPRFSDSAVESQIRLTATGRGVTTFVSSALSCALLSAFWQQRWERDIPICSHWLFIARQQARSSAFICTSETTHAIVGVRYDTSNRITVPRWRKAFMRASSEYLILHQLPKNHLWTLCSVNDSKAYLSCGGFHLKSFRLVRLHS
jgi:hypothetical protein